VGRRVYTTTRIDDEDHFYVWETHGDLAWTYSSFQYPIWGMAENLSGHVYVQTWSTLYKFDWDGNLLWYKYIPSHERTRGTSDPKIPPIIDRNGRIWLADNDSPEHFYVYDTDGAIYKQGGYTRDALPIEICVGRNGRAYIASTDNKVTCYNDWTDVLWQKSVLNGGKIGDMVMDNEDRVYVCNAIGVGTAGGNYQYTWKSLNPDNGNAIHEEVFTTSHSLLPSHRAMMALGEGRRLIILFSNGLLVTFNPVITSMPPPATGTPG
jgi:hypothetical protein